MSELQFYITTLGRVDKQISLRRLPEKFRLRTNLVVQDHEYALHKKFWDGKVRSIIPLPADIRTLGATRKFLCENLTGKVVLLDDDLLWIKRGEGLKLVQMEEQDYDEMWADVEKALDTYCHVGISARGGNNQFSAPLVENARYMRVLAYRLPFPVPVVLGRLDGMSDFDVALQLLKQGEKSGVFFKWAQDQPGTQTRGGCSINRTLDTHAQEVDLMVQLHPGIVRKRMKINKTGGLRERPEVTCYWQKAYEYSQAKRNAA